MITESVLTCPYCDFKKSEVLQQNIPLSNFRCESCQLVVKITAGECCVYCQYGDYPCIQAQIEGSSCCGRD